MKKVLLAALCATQLVACVSNNDGTVRLGWDLTVNGAPAASCDQVGAELILVLMTRNGKTTEVEFDCTPSGTGEFEIDEGLYTVEVQIVDAQGVRLNRDPFIVTREVFSGEVIDIGTFEFQFTLSFRASLRVHMGSAQVTGGNCNSTSSNGAAVVAQDIQLRSNNQCVARVITGTDDAEAQTCAQRVCQAESVVQTIEGLLPGTYTVQVLGYKGATGATPALCYASEAMPLAIINADVSLGTVFAPYLIEGADPRCEAAKPQGA
jgi:hypothetical protein